MQEQPRNWQHCDKHYVRYSCTCDALISLHILLLALERDTNSSVTDPAETLFFFLLIIHYFRPRRRFAAKGIEGTCWVTSDFDKSRSRGRRRVKRKEKKDRPEPWEVQVYRAESSRRRVETQIEESSASRVVSSWVELSRIALIAPLPQRTTPDCTG